MSFKKRKTLNKRPQILIFDIGKTNKKCIVFDEAYHVVFEDSIVLNETADEDDHPCEDLQLLADWIESTFLKISQSPLLNIKAVNFSAYGASFVYLNENGETIAPLYNYLKPFSEKINHQFFKKHGDPQQMASETASPILGNLNAGLQLYRLKYEQPILFEKIKYALHLPQYLSSLISKRFNAETTSIGCHTLLWDFQRQAYHRWAESEGLTAKFPAISPSNHTSLDADSGIKVGVGLHDSSAALIPYLASFKAPFLLLSTGTWCIALNPFNQAPLTPEELSQDCLCYLSYEGRPVKASRLFAGHEHEQAVQRLGLDFSQIKSFDSVKKLGRVGEAYLDFVSQLVEKQALAIKLVLTPTVRQIFVDGGFSKNEIFMTLLAQAFPDREVFAAEVPQASALGAAVAIHEAWNTGPLPDQLVTLKRYNNEWK